MQFVIALAHRLGELTRDRTQHRRAWSMRGGTRRAQSCRSEVRRGGMKEGDDVTGQPLGPGSGEASWAKYRPADGAGPFSMASDVASEVFERLEYGDAIHDDSRVHRGMSAIVALAGAAAQLSEIAAGLETEPMPGRLREAIFRQNTALDHLMSLAEQWWDGGPIWGDTGDHLRDVGPYSTAMEEIIASVLREIATAYEKNHGRPWDGRVDPEIPGIKWWCANDDPISGVLSDERDRGPHQALWFEGVEWRWYSEWIPCGGLRCTVEMTAAEVVTWRDEIVAAIRSK